MGQQRRRKILPRDSGWRSELNSTALRFSMPTLDDLRTDQEAALEKLLAGMDARHKRTLRRELKKHGRVEDIPQSVWDEIRADIESDEVAALLLLAIAIGDDWTADELRSRGVKARGYSSRQGSEYAFAAERRAQLLAVQTTDTLRDRLGRKLQDMRTRGPGQLGELTDDGIEQALEDVFTDQRRKTIATDQTTSGFSIGQRGAKERIDGGDGASTADGQQVAIELLWRTEQDDRVCLRCSPLEGQPEDVWGQVFTNGPGPEAHPNCRCWLEPRVVVTRQEDD